MSTAPVVSLGAAPSWRPAARREGQVLVQATVDALLDAITGSLGVLSC